MKICIEKLEVQCVHGVLPEEKKTPRPFLFDIEMETDSEDAALRDDLALTVNYSAVCALIAEVATAKSYDLIEALARECALSVLEKFPRVISVKVTVNKPFAPVPAKFSNISVCYAAERNTVYLSLGSSVGDRERTIKSAIAALGALRGVEVKRVSSMIKTAPEGGVAKNEFVNCAAELDCLLSPEALLDKIHTIEARLGRVRNVRWADRTIDIDMIFFGDKVIAGDGLAVPHPRYRERAFVTGPLKELCPEKICPLGHIAVKDM